jgi:hypothetical protein
VIALLLGVIFQSGATGTAIEGQVHVPKATTKPIPTVVYLKNLSVPRLGTESDEFIIADLLQGGHLVLVLDYGHHAKARSPDLNADVLNLREAIAGKNKTLLTDYTVDPNRLFIMPEGFRLKRDVEFARDGERVLAMDVMYPSNPKTPMPVLMEITCDNVNRMGSGSLFFCRDTLLEGGAIAGFAVAMIDHPVAPPYKGIDDPMPQLIDRLRAATRKVRELNGECNFNGKIGVIGFSRGGTMAAMLAAPGKLDVQAALIHGNRYDYLDLMENDPMLGRFEKAWGKRDENRQRWAIHGAAHFLTKDAAPMFLNTSDAESPEFRHGLDKFAARLKELGIEHVYQLDSDGRGHRVSTDPATLAGVYEFFRKHLTP